jgi:hypothetical protein
MKNIKPILLLLVELFLLTSFLQSCGNRTPILDSSVPFVVSSIEKVSDSHSVYYAESYDSGKSPSFLAEGSPAIILPSRMFQIGDTIKANFTKLK